jgi:hypothetical protein
MIIIMQAAESAPTQMCGIMTQHHAAVICSMPSPE